MINWSISYRKGLTPKEMTVYLKLCWMYLNLFNFKGKMKSCPDFSIAEQGPFHGAYTAEVKNSRIISSCILIHKKSLFLKKACFIDILLHEMAHQYCFEVLKKPHRKHTKLWKKVCKEAGCRSCN